MEKKVTWIIKCKSFWRKASSSAFSSQMGSLLELRGVSFFVDGIQCSQLILFKNLEYCNHYQAKNISYSYPLKIQNLNSKYVPIWTTIRCTWFQKSKLATLMERVKKDKAAVRIGMKYERVLLGTFSLIFCSLLTFPPFIFCASMWRLERGENITSHLVLYSVLYPIPVKPICRKKCMLDGSISSTSLWNTSWNTGWSWMLQNTYYIEYEKEPPHRK